MKAKDIRAGDVVTVNGGRYIVRDVGSRGGQVALRLAAGRTDTGFDMFVEPGADLDVYRREEARDG